MACSAQISVILGQLCLKRLRRILDCGVHILKIEPCAPGGVGKMATLVPSSDCAISKQRCNFFREFKTLSPLGCGNAQMPQSACKRMIFGQTKRCLILNDRVWDGASER